MTWKNTQNACIVILIIIFSLLVFTTFIDDFVKAFEEELWIYKAQREPHKYGKCVDCGKVKPNKLMDTNTGICDACGLIRGRPKNK